MVDGNDGTAFTDAVCVDVDGGFGEGGVDAVDGDGVVRVGGAVMLALINGARREGEGGQNVRREQFSEQVCLAPCAARLRQWTHSHDTSTTTANRRRSPA